MNHLAARLLTRLYPRPWRDRYGMEFEAFLQTERGGLSTSANIIWSAFRERIVPTRRGNMDRDSGSFQSWCVRAPWVVFALAPIFLLVVAYFVACLYLWSGWKIFLSGADTPFVPIRGPIYGLTNIYFQAGKFYYFSAPILVGWAIELIAVRQRVKAVWLTVGLVLTAWMGSAARIQASRTAVRDGLGHIRMDFTLAPSIQAFHDSLFHALAILSLTVLPYLIWRLQKTRSLSA
jgi:hypothetical protein